MQTSNVNFSTVFVFGCWCLKGNLAYYRSREKEVKRELERITNQANQVEVAHRIVVAAAGIVEDKSKVTKEEYLKVRRKVRGRLLVE